jgi:hypothetical protein
MARSFASSRPSPVEATAAANSPERPSLADWIVEAISPALIMALVGSLVYFLLEVLYRGAYGDRLRWILFFFVFGSVLVGRISMQGDIAGRALGYGFILALLVWLGMQSFVEYDKNNPASDWAPLINLFLVAVVWWSAHRLTWDCTHIDEKAKGKAAGLLQATGLEEVRKELTQAHPEEPDENLGWWERWRRYRKQRAENRTPGIWVIWFSLAALPLFGLGQALIPVEAVERRRYVFWLMLIYLGSGLGLLLTTCFLGLRRYLRQRKLPMPPAMAAVWMTVGVTLILLLLAAGAFLPRPEPEYPLFDFGLTQRSEEGREGSRKAQLKDSAGKDRGEPGGKDKENAEKGEAGRQKDAAEKGKDKDKDKDKGRGGEKGDGEKGEKGESGQDSDSSDSSSETASGLREALQKLAQFLKWVVFGLLALVVLFFVLRGFLRHLAQFTSWARSLLDALSRFWASLFGGAGGEEKGAKTEEERPAPPRTFREYPDPFLTGAAESMSEKELVLYTFAALEAWARDRGLDRLADETPLEFGARLGSQVPDFYAPVRRLVNLYVLTVYAEDAMPADVEDQLREFWEALETAGQTQEV